MTTANPQQQEVPPEREGDLHEAVYRNLLLSVTIFGRGEIAVPTMTVVAVLLELARDLAVVSGGAWLEPDLVARLRAVADDLSRRPATASLRHGWRSRCKKRSRNSSLGISISQPIGRRGRSFPRCEDRVGQSIVPAHDGAHDVAAVGVVCSNWT
jgi:hypothetical protein